jgi:hypothetical protein
VKKIKYLPLALFLIVAACSGNEATVNLAQHRTWKATGATVKENLFALNLGGEAIDEFHRLNPKLFVLTDLRNAANDGSLIQSTRTGQVYRAVFKRGDIIFLPLVN